MTDGPKTFAELQDRSGKRCRRCGEPATVRLWLQVRAIGGSKGGQPVVTSHGSELCEPCAVAIYEPTAKAMR